jgi:hypothetical protein
MIYQRQAIRDETLVGITRSSRSARVLIGTLDAEVRFEEVVEFGQEEEYDFFVCTGGEEGHETFF